MKVVFKILNIWQWRTVIPGRWETNKVNLNIAPTSWRENPDNTWAGRAGSPWRPRWLELAWQSIREERTAYRESCRVPMEVIRCILISIRIRETETQEEPPERIRENNLLTGVKNRSYSHQSEWKTFWFLGNQEKFSKDFNLSSGENSP